MDTIIKGVLGAIGMSILLTSTWSQANCQISNVSGGLIRLQPQSNATSNTQINIQCTVNFNIKFSSLNQLNNTGQSVLKNQSIASSQLQTSIPVQYTVNNTFPWNTYRSQKKNNKYQYIIVSRLGSINISNLMSGEYRDRINIYIDY